MHALSKIILVGVLVGLNACLSETSQPQGTAQKKCTIYLTFDDGPLNGSENIDSVILAEKIKISVFLVGAHVEANRRMDTYFKYYEENPYIDEYNHSYSHAYNHYEKFYNNPQTTIADILKNQQLLKLHYKIVRLPGRNMWRLNGKKRDDGISGASTADGLAAKGYKVIGWDLEWQHHPDGRPVQTVTAMFDEIAQRCKTGNTFTQGNIVLLIHDEMFQTKWEESALKQLVDRLKASGDYTFEQIRFYPQ